MTSREWKTSQYAVRVRHDHRELAWIEYEESGRTLVLRAEFGAEKRLLVWIPNKVYLPPDYQNELPESRITAIQNHILDALSKLAIEPEFARIGWTSAK
jgi:hypothetical protein